MKAVVARFNAQEMTSQRATVSNLIMRELTERANTFGARSRCSVFALVVSPIAPKGSARAAAAPNSRAWSPPRSRRHPD